MKTLTRQLSATRLLRVVNWLTPFRHVRYQRVSSRKLITSWSLKKMMRKRRTLLCAFRKCQQTVVTLSSSSVLVPVLKTPVFQNRSLHQNLIQLTLCSATTSHLNLKIISKSRRKSHNTFSKEGSEVTTNPSTRSFKRFVSSNLCSKTHFIQPTHFNKACHSNTKPWCTTTSIIGTSSSRDNHRGTECKPLELFPRALIWIFHRALKWMKKMSPKSSRNNRLQIFLIGNFFLRNLEVGSKRTNENELNFGPSKRFRFKIL